MSTSIRNRSSALIFGLLLASGLASAQMPASPALDDVCPGAQAALQDRLGPTLAREGLPGTVAIDMQVQDGQIAQLQASGPFEYRRAVRRALGELNCGSTGAGRQQLQFQVQFKPES